MLLVLSVRNQQQFVILDLQIVEKSYFQVVINFSSSQDLLNGADVADMALRDIQVMFLIMLLMIVMMTKDNNHDGNDQRPKQQ